MKLKPVSKKEALKDAKKFLAMVRMSVDVCANTRVREGVMTVKEMERDIRIGAGHSSVARHTMRRRVI